MPQDTALAAGSRFTPVNELRTKKDAQLVRGALRHEDQFGFFLLTAPVHRSLFVMPIAIDHALAIVSLLYSAA